MQEKLKSGSYRNIASVKHDISHAFWNAKRCKLPGCFRRRTPFQLTTRLGHVDNEKGTTIFLDAKFLDVRLVWPLFSPPALRSLSPL